MTELTLRTLLCQVGIPLTSWGGKNKDVPQLFKELTDGECDLRIRLDTTTGTLGLVRVTNIVKMEIVDADNSRRGNLLECFQTLPNGQIRDRKRKMPSGKIKTGELPKTVLGRELEEELELEPSDWYITGQPEVYEESNESPSYPGLNSVYVIHRFQISISMDSPALMDKFSILDPSDGSILHFEWEHLGLGKPATS